MYNPRRNGGGPIHGRLGNMNPDYQHPRYQQQSTKSIFDVVRRQRMLQQQQQYADSEPYDDVMPGPSYESDYNPLRSHPNYNNDGPSMPSGYHRQQQQSFSYSNGSQNKIPSLLEIQPESQPAPLLPPESVERLRANLRSSGYSYNEEIGEWEPKGVASETHDAAAALMEQFDVRKLLKEEKATKKKIDEIIRVAQALRDKLEKEEELRKALEAINDAPRELNEYHDNDDDLRYEEGPPIEEDVGPRDDPCYESPRAYSVRSDKLPDHKIPSLFDIKPAIPSLLDMHVPPPEEIPDNLQMTIQNNRYERETCWNCETFGHGFTECMLPQQKEFCFRCGNLGVDIYTCPCAPPPEEYHLQQNPPRFMKFNY